MRWRSRVSYYLTQPLLNAKTNRAVFTVKVHTALTAAPTLHSPAPTLVSKDGPVNHW